MGAKRQGRRTTKRAIQAIDDLNVVLGTIEGDTVASLRRLPAHMDRLDLCLRLIGTSSKEASSELTVAESVRRNLEPLVDMVSEPDVVAPPFSPNLRQRISYATALLTAMRDRLSRGDTRVRRSAVRKEADARFGAMVARWKAFRSDPTLDNLTLFESTSCLLTDFYWALGISKNEPRVKSVRRLCGLLEKASDREGELDDVPALVREVNQAANELSRPTAAEHRRWIESVR